MVACAAEMMMLQSDAAAAASLLHSKNKKLAEETEPGWWLRLGRAYYREYCTVAETLSYFPVHTHDVNSLSEREVEDSEILRLNKTIK